MDCTKGLTVECSMCGDVGFPEKLQQCKACGRVQHIYCSESKEGLKNGNKVCDWCRAEDERKTEPEMHVLIDMKEATREFSQCTLKSPDTSNGLEFLIKAALSCKEEFPLVSGATKVTSKPIPTANCGSNCSSSVESEKVSFGVRSASCGSNCSSSVESEKVSFGARSASCGLGDASSNLRSQRMVTDTSISDEEGSIGTVQIRTTSAACDIKRSPSSLRCIVRGGKGTKQKQIDVKALKTQLSLPSKYNAPVPLKRLSSLKVLSRSNNMTMVDDQPRGLVRRYKSLSDICY